MRKAEDRRQKPEDRSIALARCDQEMREIRERRDVIAGEVRAWLVVLGLEDWEMEKRLIQAAILSSDSCLLSSSGEAA
jgi:hypothetical protein